MSPRFVEFDNAWFRGCRQPRRRAQRLVSSFPIGGGDTTSLEAGNDSIDAPTERPTADHADAARHYAP
jgi:hypothetical protein